jgi:hypothetical protein
MHRPVLVLILLLAVASPLPAQQEAGDIELQFTGSILTTMGQDRGSITLGIFQAKGGYFLTDRIEVGGFPSVTFVRATVQPDDWPTEVTTSETKVGLGIFGTYSFLAADATTVPYVGAQFYRIDLTDEDETGWLGASLGLKFYMTPRTAFDVGGNGLVGLGNDGGILLLFQMGLSFLL